MSANVVKAGSGMGRACAVAFAKAGAKLLLVDIVEAGLKDTLKEIGDVSQPVKIFTLDITNDEAVIALIKSIPQLPEFGRLDYALNCAGVLGRVRAPFAESDQKDVDWIMNINLRAQGLMMQEEIKVMLAQEPLPSSNSKFSGPRGCIVNWASWVSFHGSKTSYAYAASKHGIAALTKCAAISHAGQGIRVNAVAPGIMNTPLVAAADKASLERFLSLVPQNRLGEPEEVADVALYLCSDRSSYINGTIVNVDGAWHAS